MPTLEATLLPPVAAEDRAADCHLDEVGVGAALDAMREQKIRRSSFPAAAEVEGDMEALLDPDATNEIPRAEPHRRVPQDSDAFLKAR